jgi:hypothetical protein
VERLEKSTPDKVVLIGRTITMIKPATAGCSRSR